jgi:hypothetical protein
MSATLTLKTQSVHTNKFSFATGGGSAFVADVARADLINSCLDGGPLWTMFIQADDPTKWAALNYRFDFTVEVAYVGGVVPVSVQFLNDSGLKMRVTGALTAADASIALRFEHSMVN